MCIWNVVFNNKSRLTFSAVMLLHACVLFSFHSFRFLPVDWILNVRFLLFSLLIFACLKRPCGFLLPPQSHIISVRKCVFTREGGSEWRCWCIEQSCLSLLKAFVSWGSLFITKPLVGRDIKTGCDPGVSPLTSLNPRGQIFSNCAITISWPQGL